MLPCKKLHLVQTICDMLTCIVTGAKSIDIDMKIFEEYFKRIDKISNMLEKLIWDRIENADTTAYDDPAVLVRIVQIIEREEERDTIRHMSMK